MNYYKRTYNKILNQKMELIDYKYINNTHKFIILGYSRNVYTIEIMNDGYMECNCPYALDDNFPCKHIFFIIFKVSPIFKKFYTNKKNLIYNFISAPLSACKSSFLQDRMNKILALWHKYCSLHFILFSWLIKGALQVSSHRIQVVFSL